MTSKPSPIIMPPAEPEPKIKPREPFNCTHCHHFEAFANDQNIGSCLRYPPVVHVIGMAQGHLQHQVEPVTRQFVPRADITWVCGEFKARDVQ